MHRPDTDAGRAVFNGLILTALLLLGSALAAERAAASQRAPLALPATFAGELPCADCTGQRIALTLFGDRTYRLRRTYLGATDTADKDFYDLGRWAWDDTDKPVRIQLNGGGPGQRYRLLSPEHLQVSNDGTSAAASPAYTLTRQPQTDAIAGPMRLRGFYAYQADAALFNECRTGKRYPVSLEAGHAEIERAYLALTADNPGSPLLATVDGRFVMRATDPSAAPREHLVIERFERFWQGETCAREALAQASLYNTYWRPVEIDGEPVPLAPQQREPFIILSANEKRVKGSTGCNRLTGGFEQDSDGLHFTALATTRMACPPAVARTETRFLDALNATAAQRIVGESLELSDATGQVRMRLEARYLH